MSAERCMCGADDCPRCYPHRKQGAVTESHREEAIEQTVETLMDYGQYPAKGRPQLELYDILIEELHADYINKFYVDSMSAIDPGMFIIRERKAVAELLWLWLKDTDLIDELAQDICNDRSEK